jgi:predicted NUDIX family NTP pyrophosphohydrolase
MPITSAGLLVYRTRRGALEVLLGHMGGPFWAKKDERAWSIPKGEHATVEDPLAAARREFREEMGSAPPAGAAIPLGEVKQPGGKVVSVWAVEGDFEPVQLRSNAFTLEWPPKSGRFQDFPEIDRAGWFEIEVARQKLVRGQVPFIDLLLERLRSAQPSRASGSRAR